MYSVGAIELENKSKKETPPCSYDEYSTVKFLSFCFDIYGFYEKTFQENSMESIVFW